MRVNPLTKRKNKEKRREGKRKHKLKSPRVNGSFVCLSVCEEDFVSFICVFPSTPGQQRLAGASVTAQSNYEYGLVLCLAAI